jgi:hypothetical protein
MRGMEERDQSSTTIRVPMGLPERPAAPARSLHSVRMPTRQVEHEAVWEPNKYNPEHGEFRWRPVAESPEPEPTPQPTQPYQQHEVNMEDQSNGQQPQLPQPPDPMSYDFFDPSETARFHQDNSAYYQQLVDQRVQAHLAPHAESLREVALRRDYNAAVERYGDDENFQDVMNVALANCAEAQRSGKQFSIIAAYQAANDVTAARPGQKGSAHLPEAFRDKRRGIGMFGRIIEHNHQTGRAKPFGGRNWRG